ncbi:sulfatase [Coraliomargarita parva]|uniref:sulfatase n=1 Tax=Coraliomargarita parva TaxID=3014050 RepID=UPI0022B2DA36|nr:sulfatase [Coraliomargarita parva]
MNLIGVYWFLQILIFVAFSLAIGDTSIQDPYFKDFLGIRFILIEVNYAGLPAVVLGMAAYWRHHQRTQNWLRILLSTTTLWLCALVVSFYNALNWGQFLYVGKFIEWDSLLFYAASPWHLLEHAIHFSIAGTISLLLLGCSISAVWVYLPSWIPKRADKGSKIKWGTLFVLCIACTTLIYEPFSIYQISSSESGRYRLGGAKEYSVTTIGDHLDSLLDQRTGPYTSLVRSINKTGPMPRSQSVSAHKVEFDTYLSPEAYGQQNRQIFETTRAYNVIIIVIESLRVDQLTQWGGSRVVMPHLETLAHKSAVFTRHFASSSHSNYADVSILSGTYPFWSERIHVYPEATSYPRPRIYDLLRESGYTTSIISSQNENWGGMLNYYESTRLDYLFHANALESAKPFYNNPIKRHAGKCPDTVTLEIATNWIRAQTQPFFTYINLQSTHYPYYFPETMERPFGKDMDVSGLNFLNLPPQQIPDIYDRYADSLNYVDQLLGRFLDKLSQNGQLKDSIVIISGDTAQAFGEHGFTGHASKLYNEVVQTPLIIYKPDQAPATYEGLSHHTDIAPMILSLLGLPPYPGFQGHSLLEGDKREWAPLVCQSPAMKQVALVTSKYKLFYDFSRGTYQLFDTSRDPGELDDLYAAAFKKPEIQILQDTLLFWAEQQIRYYGDRTRHTSHFAPKFKSPDMVQPASPLRGHVKAH